MTITTNINTLGGGIKGWLRFNNLTWTLSGVPPVYASGVYNIQLKVSDPYGASVTDTFTLNVNAKPAIPTSGLYAGIDKVYKIPQGTTTIKLGNYFYDSEVALSTDQITYTIK